MFPDSTLTWSGPRDRWARVILIVAAVGVLIAVWAAVSTLRARAQVHEAAKASLSNYAAVAIEQFVNGYEALLRDNFVPILEPLPPAALVERMKQLQRDPCRCRIAPGPSMIFRLGIDSNEEAGTDSLGRPLALDPAVVRLVRTEADSVARVGWGYGFELSETAMGRQFVFFAPQTDSATGRRYAYGFAIPAAHMVDRIFRPAFQSLRVIPRHLLATVRRNDEFVSFEVLTSGGAMLFATAPAYPDGPSNGLILPALRGGLFVRGHLNPQIKDALIPGGIPGPIPFRDLGLTGLSLALLLAIAVLGLRAGALARLRSDLASSVTHEMRTPLTQIRLAAETVLLGRSPTAQAEARSLSSIIDESKRLQQLIDNVLHFSRAERRLSASISLAPIALRPVLQRAADDLGALVADRGVTLDVDIASDLVVRGDANALRQIALNLLDNAARYGADHQTVRIGAQPHDGQVDWWVEDRGPGIPVADRRRVWKAFVRLDRDREPATTGTGLGLAVVRELVEAQGGRCWIEEAQGSGARVVVRMPREATPS